MSAMRTAPPRCSRQPQIFEDVARPRPLESRRAEPPRPDGGRLTLAERIGSVWEGLLAAGAAECPMCHGQLRRTAAGARCSSCGTELR